MKKNILFIVMVFFILTIQAQTPKASDSVVIKVGKSRIIVSIKDTADIRTLKSYDLEALIEEALEDGEKNDSLIRRYEGTHFKFKKFPSETEWMEIEALSKANQEAFRERAKEMAHRELQMLREQERLLESGSDSDREELKRMIKERAERLKYRTKEMTNRGLEFDFEWEGDGSFLENSNEEKEEIRKRTYNSTNFDFGTNNYLAGGQFPEESNAPYTVRPFGSWYFAVNNIYRTRVARKLFLEWGVGVSAYNFKFQNDSIQVLRNSSGVQFLTDNRELDFRKSKLTASYVQASFVPVLDFGGNRHKPGLFDGVGAASFRIGAGPYVGYRIMSYSKQYFKEDGEKQRVRDHDHFYLNNLRYGLRFQVGYREADLFLCYDLNELFASGKGPGLNAFSFGISF